VPALQLCAVGRVGRVSDPSPKHRAGTRGSSARPCAIVLGGSICQPANMQAGRPAALSGSPGLVRCERQGRQPPAACREVAAVLTRRRPQAAARDVPVHDGRIHGGRAQNGPVHGGTTATASAPSPALPPPTTARATATAMKRARACSSITLSFSTRGPQRRHSRACRVRLRVASSWRCAAVAVAERLHCSSC
jgi:hypothetical protein